MNCFLNGEMMPLSAAKVSVMDRGFLFGDGVYEVVPAYGRKLFCWRRHLRRLSENLRKIQMAAELAEQSGIADRSGGEIDCGIRRCGFHAVCANHPRRGGDKAACVSGAAAFADGADDSIFASAGVRRQN